MSQKRKNEEEMIDSSDEEFVEDDDIDLDEEDVEIDEDDIDDEDSVLSFDENTPVSGNPKRARHNEDEMFNTAVSSTENDYMVWDYKDIIKKQQVEVERVAEVLGISNSSARVLLRKFEWKSENIMNTFFEKELAGVLKQANITIDDIKMNQDENENADDDYECPLCLDDKKISQTTRLPCGHRFCNDCWRYHIELKIKEGQSRVMKCMAFKCLEAIDESVVSKIVTDKHMRAMYEKSIVESYIEDNKNIKWCTSTPSCGNCVQTNLPPSIPLDIRCYCSHEFCFKCTNHPHLPATCEMMKGWLQKSQDDSETANYIVANTKECPKCGKVTEKSSGCNHMTCICSYHWCWLCNGHFADYQHSCGRYKTPTYSIDHNNADVKRDESVKVSNARTLLERYMHYFTRYKVHEDSRNKEKVTRDAIREKMKVMATLQRNATFDIDKIEESTETLFRCRKTMQYAYVAGYYMFDDSGQDLTRYLVGVKKFKGQQKQLAQTIWEDNVEQLEMAVESLSKLLESPVEEIVQPDTKKNIMGSTVLVDKRLTALYSILNEELMEEGCQLPKPRPVIPRTLLKK